MTTVAIAFLILVGIGCLIGVAFVIYELFENEIDEFIDFHFKEETEYYRMQVYDGYCLRTIIVRAINRNHLYYKLAKMEGKVAYFTHRLSLRDPIEHICEEDLEKELLKYRRNGGVIF